MPKKLTVESQYLWPPIPDPQTTRMFSRGKLHANSLCMISLALYFIINIASQIKKSRARYLLRLLNPNPKHILASFAAIHKIFSALIEF